MLPLLLLRHRRLLVLLVPFCQRSHLLILQQVSLFIGISVGHVIPGAPLFLLSPLLSQFEQSFVELIDAFLDLSEGLVPEHPLLVHEPPLEKIQLLLLTHLQVFLTRDLPEFRDILGLVLLSD